MKNSRKKNTYIYYSNWFMKHFDPFMKECRRHIYNWVIIHILCTWQYANRNCFREYIFVLFSSCRQMTLFEIINQSIFVNYCLEDAGSLFILFKSNAGHFRDWYKRSWCHFARNIYMLYIRCLTNCITNRRCNLFTILI